MKRICLRKRVFRTVKVFFPPESNEAFPRACYLAEYNSKLVTSCGQPVKGPCYVVHPLSHSHIAKELKK